MYEQIEKLKERRSKTDSIANASDDTAQNLKQGIAPVYKPPKTFEDEAQPPKDDAPDSEPIQRKENDNGLPDNLKTGIENLSGYAMDDVKVHYNSDKPAKYKAHAFTQGTDIHIASGQEKHLPHEAWHSVQQKQGRVKPTLQMKNDVAINDDEGLETEADVMGSKATVRQEKAHHAPLLQPKTDFAPVQRVSFQKEFSGPALGTEVELSQAVIFKTSSVPEIAVVKDSDNNDLVEITSDMVSGAVLMDVTEETKQEIFNDYSPDTVVDIDGQPQKLPGNLSSYTIELITHPALAKGQDDQLSEEATSAWTLRQKAFSFAVECIKAAGEADEPKNKHLTEASKDNLKLSLHSDMKHIIQTSGTPSFTSSNFQATYSQASEAVGSDRFLDATWLKDDVSTEVGNLTDIEGYDKIEEDKRQSFKKAVEYVARIIKKVIAINKDKPLLGIDPNGKHSIHDPDVKNAWHMLPRTLVKETVGHIIGSDEKSMIAYRSYLDIFKKKGAIEKAIIDTYIVGETGFARTQLSNIKANSKGASAFEIRSGGDAMHPYSAPKSEVIATQSEQWGEFYNNPALQVYRGEKSKKIAYIYWHIISEKIIYMERGKVPKWYIYDPKTKSQVEYEDPRSKKETVSSEKIASAKPPSALPDFLK